MVACAGRIYRTDFGGVVYSPFRLFRRKGGMVEVVRVLFLPSWRPHSSRLFYTKRFVHFNLKIIPVSGRNIVAVVVVVRLLDWLRE